jgi:hypothetical protein
MDKAAGDDIPRIAIVAGTWDRWDVLLGKLGKAKLTPSGLSGLKVECATAGLDYYLWHRLVSTFARDQKRSRRELVGAWTHIAKTNSVNSTDKNGNPVVVTPKTFMGCCR